MALVGRSAAEGLATAEPSARCHAELMPRNRQLRASWTLCHLGQAIETTVQQACDGVYLATCCALWPQSMDELAVEQQAGLPRTSN